MVQKVFIFLILFLMSYNPPIHVLSNTEPTYEVEVYLRTTYDIENIKKCIEHGFLSKVQIPKEKETMEIYDIGDEWFNVFIIWEKDIEEHWKIDPFETIAMLEKFIS